MPVYCVVVQLKEIAPRWIILVPNAKNSEDAANQAEKLIRHFDKTPQFISAYRQDKPSIIYTVEGD